MDLPQQKWRQRRRRRTMNDNQIVKYKQIKDLSFDACHMATAQ